MSNLQVFQNDRFGLVRTIDRNGEPWFLAADICCALSLSNTTEALRALDQDERSTEKMKVGTRMQDINVVSESGMYALIMRSNKPEARAFRKWVTSVVIPKIRKTGSFSDLSTDALVERTVNNPDWVVKMITAYKDEKEKRQLAEEQRDAAVRAKAHITAGREATIIGKLAAKSKECVKLREENCKLKSQLGIECEEERNDYLPMKSIKWIHEVFEGYGREIYNILASRLKMATLRLGMKVRKNRKVHEYPIAAIEDVYNRIMNDGIQPLIKYRKK